MQNCGKKMLLILFLMSYKLNDLLYLLTQKLQENIKQYVTTLFYSLHEQFNWEMLSPDPSIVFLMGCSAALLGLREQEYGWIHVLPCFVEATLILNG